MTLLFEAKSGQYVCADHLSVSPDNFSLQSQPLWGCSFIPAEVTGPHLLCYLPPLLVTSFLPMAKWLLELSSRVSYWSALANSCSGILLSPTKEPCLLSRMQPHPLKPEAWFYSREFYNQTLPRNDTEAHSAVLYSFIGQPYPKILSGWLPFTGSNPGGHSKRC